MRLLDVTLPTLVENLALDEALLLAADSGTGGEVLRFWRWPTPAVVLGSGGKLAEDVCENACLSDAVPIARRSSGGGTVLLGRGCLIYTLVLSYQRDPELAEIRSSYRFILGRIAEALADGVGPIGQAGVSDLILSGRKFSGTAQQRKRGFLLHHGTLLYDFDLPSIPRYLHEPPLQPEYRAGRGHLDFVCNLPLEAADIERRLRTVWEADEPLSTWPAETASQLVAAKYGNPTWTKRR
jgi:lipoate-protein ligase A